MFSNIRERTRHTNPCLMYKPFYQLIKILYAPFFWHFSTALSNTYLNKKSYNLESLNTEAHTFSTISILLCTLRVHKLYQSMQFSSLFLVISESDKSNQENPFLRLTWLTLNRGRSHLKHRAVENWRSHLLEARSREKEARRPRKLRRVEFTWCLPKVGEKPKPGEECSVEDRYKLRIKAGTNLLEYDNFRAGYSFS